MRAMSRVVTLVGLLVALVALGTPSPLLATSEVEEAAKAARQHFGKKRYEVLIPLLAVSAIRAALILPEGRFDPQIYADWVGDSPNAHFSLKAGQIGKRFYVGVKEKKNRIIIFLCKGRGACMKPSYLVLEYSRPLTPADLAPENIVAATSQILKIEGESLGGGFEPEAVLADVTEAEPVALSPADSAAAAAAASVTVYSAQVEPTEVGPGTDIQLIIHFEVADLPAGAAVPLVEEHQIMFEGRSLFTIPLTYRESWTNGRHNSTIELTIPPNAEPGAYTFIAQIGRQGQLQRKSALFLVR